MGPEVLALDEPLSHLDLEGPERILDVLRGLKRDGMTIILFSPTVYQEVAFGPKSLAFILYPFTGLSPLMYKAAFILILAGLWGSVFSQALFFQESPRTVLLTLIPGWLLILGRLTGGVYLYREGLIYGFIQGFRLSAMTAAGLLFCWTTDPRGMLLGLTRLKIPHEIAFMLVCSLRFLPVLMVELLTVTEIQRMKGYHPLKLRNLISGSLNTLTPVLANAIRRAATLADSVESRAFRAYPMPHLPQGIALLSGRLPSAMHRLLPLPVHPLHEAPPHPV